MDGQPAIYLYIAALELNVLNCRRPGVVGTPCFRENRVVMPLRAAIECVEERLVLQP
jgi:hypothetical protein